MKREKGGMFNFKMIKILFLIAGIVLLAGESFAYVIDGNLSPDWGVTPGQDWQPNKGVFWVVDDQRGDIYTYLGPGYGGQFYDVEAIYFDYDENNAYIAIVTGFPQSGRDYGGYYFYPGDIALDFGIDRSYEYGIITSSNRPSYALSGSPGDVYKVTSWATAYEGTHPGIWQGVSDPTVIKEGEQKKNVSLYYKSAGDEHYVIETSVPLNIFGDDWQIPLRIHWTETCGNDYLNLDVIPEPSSIFLLSLGLFGLGSLLRKKYS